MKKLLIMTAIALTSIGASAQGTITLSTYKGTEPSKYAGKTLNVTANRYIFKGWNTISLPFALNSAQLDEIFGSDCKLEKLVGVENDGLNVKLNFRDIKREGLKANTPYILYYTGETGTKKIQVENASLTDGAASITFTAEGTGEKVTMACAKLQKEAKGLYGILAKDNSEAAFVNVDNTTTGFYATRCYVQLSNGNSTTLTTNHISGDVTNINAVANADELVDVYNISGVKVASQITPAEVSNLQSGIYVVKGVKVAVKW